jgi:putative membrane protein
MKRIFVAVCCICTVSIPGLAQKKAAHAPMSDQDFVNFAAQTDMVEANLGQLAQTAASSQEVKDYAQTLVTDHTNDYKQLSTIAQQANLTMPGSIDEEQNKTMVGPFQKLNGAAFDHKYIMDMVAGHTKALEIFKKEAADAQNPALKAYAEQDEAALEKHLSGAKDLEKAKTK